MRYLIAVCLFCSLLFIGYRVLGPKDLVVSAPGVDCVQRSSTPYGHRRIARMFVCQDDDQPTATYYTVEVESSLP